MEEKWDRRFLEMAKLVSSWSKDPSTQCGAVITKGNRIISLGFNGFPKGVSDLPERYNNRETKYKMTIHAEVNAILFSDPCIKNCTIFVYPMLPCSRCACQIIQTGIKKVVSIKPSEDLLFRWGNEIKISKIMYKEVGIEVKLYDRI